MGFLTRYFWPWQEASDAETEASKHADLSLANAREVPELAVILSWWESFPSMPSRKDISPFSIPKSLLPCVSFSDVERDPFRVKIRLAGTLICEDHGWDVSGHYVDELYSPEDWPAVEKGLKAVVGGRRPAYSQRKVIASSGRYIEYKRLLLPLSEDGKTITGLLTCAKRIVIDP